MQTPPPTCTAEPIQSLPAPSTEEKMVGKELLSAHLPLIGTILLAGGMGSRLNQGIKGFLPLAGKTLFEIFIEKIASYQTLYSAAFPLAIMTNQQSTHFVKNLLLQKRTPFPIDCFTQTSLPLLSPSHSPLPLEGPDGNGLLFKHFYQSPIYKMWLSLGVKYISVIPIDNPLAESIDPGMLGAVYKENASIGISCVPQKTIQEPGGRLSSVRGQIQILEHVAPDTLKHYPLINTGIYMFNISCIEHLAFQQPPLHLVPKQWKKHKILKREYFLLDLFPHAEKVIARQYPRQKCFAPIKKPQDIHPSEQAFLLKRFHSIT